MLSKFLSPKNDVAFKKIFGSEKNKDILIHFINDILEFKGEHQVKEVEFLPTIQDPDIASKKQSIVDVLCRDTKGLQYIIEMQVDPMQGFEKRAQYYAAKAYCRQTDRGKGETGQYHNLKQIIFVAISDSILFPNKKAYKSRHIISDAETQEHDLKDFSFTFIELPKFKKQRGDSLDNIIEKWCYFFKYADGTHEKEIDKITGSDLVIKDAYEALNQFNWSEAELIAYEQEQKRIWDNRAVMETALNMANAQGMAQGMAQGRAEGMAQGMAKGMAKGMAERDIEIAKRMLALGMDIKTISSVTALSEEVLANIKN